MVRIGAVLCFALTLLCPIFCLAETGDACSAHASRDGENCEAMSIGAVVEKLTRGIASPDQSLLFSEGLPAPAKVALDPSRRSRSTAWYRGRAKPPPAASRRQALLQSFLF
jgi:hypothetical protein